MGDGAMPITAHCHGMSQQEILDILHHGCYIRSGLPPRYCEIALLMASGRIYGKRQTSDVRVLLMCPARWVDSRLAPKTSFPCTVLAHKWEAKDPRSPCSFFACFVPSITVLLIAAG